jgi:hypothetical protein
MTSEEAVMYALLALKRCKSKMALYWSNGKLKATQAESSHYQSSLSDHAPNLLGIYSAFCNPQLIADDVMTFFE